MTGEKGRIDCADLRYELSLIMMREDRLSALSTCHDLRRTPTHDAFTPANDRRDADT